MEKDKKKSQKSIAEMKQSGMSLRDIMIELDRRREKKMKMIDQWSKRIVN